MKADWITIITAPIWIPLAIIFGLIKAIWTFIRLALFQRDVDRARVNIAENMAMRILTADEERDMKMVMSGALMQISNGILDPEQLDDEHIEDLLVYASTLPNQELYWVKSSVEALETVRAERAEVATRFSA